MKKRKWTQFRPGVFAYEGETCVWENVTWVFHQKGGWRSEQLNLSPPPHLKTMPLPKDRYRNKHAHQLPETPM